jgi:hypothetical protein
MVWSVEEERLKELREEGERERRDTEERKRKGRRQSTYRRKPNPILQYKYSVHRRKKREGGGGGVNWREIPIWVREGSSSLTCFFLGAR